MSSIGASVLARDGGKRYNKTETETKIGGNPHMDQQKIDRINVLARKSKAEGLTPEEKA